MIIIYLVCVILNKTLLILFFFFVLMLRRRRQRVNFHIQRNETDRLEKNGIDGDAATDCIEWYRKKKKREENSAQYSITQIDTDKEILEAILCSSFFSSCVRIERIKLNLNKRRKKSECESI